MNQDAVLHELQFEFCLDRLTIEIKFPCRITFSVKIGKQECLSTESVTLDGCKAEFLQPVSAVGNLYFSDGSYLERKCYLTVYVESSSGRNIAGVCTIDLAAYTAKEWMSLERQLERCPDRNARVNIRVRAAFLRQLAQNPSESGHSEDIAGSLHRTTRNVSVHLPSSFRPDMPVRQPKTIANLRIEGVKGRDNSSNSRKPDEKSSLESSRGNSRNDSDRVRLISELKNNVNEKDRKLTRLEIEKQSLGKEAEGLRQQLETLRGQRSTKSSRELELIGENERLKRKLESTESALEILKLKKQEWEKKDSERRQTIMIERSLTDELLTKEQANADLDKELKLTKKAREELDRVLREKLRELREAFEKNDDLTNSVKTLEKRLQMKEAFYKEEIRKYNEKQVSSEAERQRYWVDLNNEKEVSEQKERKATQALRDAEKAWFDERAKLIKKTEQLRQQLESTTLLQDNYFKQIEEQTEAAERLAKSLVAAEEDRINLSAQLERTKKQLAQEMGFRQKYEDEVREKNALRQQKANLEKELEQFMSEKTLNYSESSRQLIERNDALRNANEKLADLNRKLREKEQKVMELQTFTEALTKKNEALRKSEEKRTAELAEAKNVERTLQSEAKELQKANQELELNLQNAKFKGEHQQEELKKLLKKALDETESLRTKLRLEGEESVKLEDSVKVINEKYSVTLESNSRLEERLKKLELQLLESGFREKDLKQQLERTALSLAESKEALKREQQKNDDIYEKVGKLESENIRLTYAQEQLARFEKQLKEREAELQERRTSETNLELNVQMHESTLFSLKEELKTKASEFAKERSMTESLRKDLAAAVDNGQNLNRQLQQVNSELADVKKELARSQTDRKSTEERLSSVQTDHKRYRSTTIESLKAFVTALFSNKDPIISEGDYDIIELQRDLQKKHKRLLELHSSQIELCKQHLGQQAKDQMDAAERKSSQIECQLRADLETKREEFHYFREGMLVKQDELTRELQEAQQLLSQNLVEVGKLQNVKEKLEKEVHRLLLENEEALAVGDQRKRELDLLIADNKQLEEEILRERQMKEDIFTKAYNEREQTHSQMQESQKVMQQHLEELEGKLRDKDDALSTLNQQIRGLNKQLEVRSENIRAGERQLQESIAANQSLESKLANAQKKERDLLERIRQGEQALQLEQQKSAQLRSSLGVIPAKERELQELRVTFDRERDTLSSKLAYVEQLNRAAEQNLARFKQESLQLQEDLTRAHGEIRRFTEAARTTEEALSKKSLAFDQRTAELATARDRIQRLEKELQLREDSQEEFARRSQTALSSASLEKEELTRKFNQLDLEFKKEIDSKAVLSRDFERELAASQAESQKLKERIDELQGLLQNSEAMASNLNKKEQDLQSDLNHLHEVIHDLELENGKQQFELEVKERDLDEVTRRLALSEQELRNQQQQLKQRDATIQGLQNNLTETNKNREGQNNQLRQHCQSLELALEKYKEDKEFLYRQLKDELERSNQLIREKDEVRQSYEQKLNGVHKDHSEDRRNLIQSQNDHVQRIARLTSENNRLDNDNRELMRKLSMVAANNDQANSIKMTRLEQELQSNIARITRFEQELREVSTAKAEAEAGLIRLMNSHQEEKLQIERAYDSEIRQIEAKRQQQTADHEAKIKKIYREKYEDEAALKFEVQRLKDELDQSSASRRSTSSAATLATNLSEFKQEVADYKMKHHLAGEPLRNVETLLPHIIWLCQDSEALISRLENRIAELEQGQSSRNYISASRVAQGIKPSSDLMEKLRQAEDNCRLIKQRMDDMTRDFDHINEERLKVLGKSRELLDLLNDPSAPHQLLIDKICEILDYSRQKTQSRPQTPQTPQTPERLVSIKRVESGGRVTTAEVWYRDRATEKLEVRRLPVSQQPPAK